MPFRSGQQTQFGRLCSCIVVCAMGGTQAGCAFNGNFLALLSPDRPQPCVLAQDSTVHQVVQHLNTNIAPLRAWRSTDVKIVPHGQGAIIGMRLSARIAVEQPRNFRLMVTALSNPEADLGSNDEKSWFWMRRGPSNIITVRHADIGRVQALPFDPQWLTEVLGVVSFNEDELKMDPPKEERGPIQLVADHQFPDGRRVRRKITVDSCRGHVDAHELYDSSNQLIARADLSDYRAEVASGVELPHQIKINWPLFGFGLTMTIGDIEINPVDMAKMWEMPRPPGFPELDLATVGAPPRKSADASRPNNRSGVNQAPPFHDDFAGGNSGDPKGSIQQLNHESAWEPPTLRDANNSRPSTPQDAPPKRRTWWQRAMGR